MSIKMGIKKCISIIIIFTILSYILPIESIKAFIKSDDILKIQILATSDLQGKFTSYEYNNDIKLDGGLTQIATLIKEEKEKNKNTIVIDNGNTIQGNYNHLFLDDEENPMILAMNEIGYDVFNLGNNDLKLGINKINEIKEQVNDNLNMICANLYKDKERVFDGYTIKEVDNNIKIATIGVITSSIGKYEIGSLDGYEIKDPIDEVGVVIDEIKKKGGADIYVLSANSGLENYSQLNEYNSLTEIAEKYDEISAIIINNTYTRKDIDKVNNAIFIQPASNGLELGKIEITLEKSNNKYKVLSKESELIPTKDIEDDKELVEKIKSYHERAIEDSNIKIGILDKTLATENEVLGIPESIIRDEGITDFINEVQLYYSREQLESVGVNMDDAYNVSAASLSDYDINVMEGDITKGAIDNICRNNSKLYTIKITGKELKDFMEWTVAIYNKFNDGDLTVSLNEGMVLDNYHMFDGVSYEINISNEAGERIQCLTFEKDNKVVNDNDVIYLALNSDKYDYILNLADNSILDIESHKKIYDSINDKVSDIRALIIDYITNVNYGEVKRNVDNNWKLTGIKYDTEKRKVAVRMINEGKIIVPSSKKGQTLAIKSITWDEVIKASDKAIDIMSLNDFHGKVQEEGDNVGAAKLTTVIKEKQALKNDYYEAFVVAAGDNYEGVAISSISCGKSVSEFFKEINLIASALGNHEFDLGLDKIKQWSKEGEFPFLAANIVDKDSKNPIEWAEPYIIIESNGLKIGVIGISNPETISKTNAKNIENLEFTLPENAINKYAKELTEEKHVNAVVVLSHLGAYKNEVSGEIEGEAAELAKSVYNVDAIIAADNHEYIDGVVNNIPIVEAGYNGRALSNLNFSFNVEGKLLNVEGTTEELYKKASEIIGDEFVTESIREYEEDLNIILSEKITDLDRELNNKEEGLTDIGIVIAEAVKRIANVDIAIINGGTISEGLEQGEITVEDVYNVLQFEDDLVTIELKGEDIKATLEHGIMPEGYSWGQFSGIKVYYDKNKEPNERITSINFVNGQPLEMDKYYKVVINDFMLNGGDNYQFTNGQNIVDTNIVMSDSIINLWKNEGIDTTTEELLVQVGDSRSITLNEKDKNNDSEEIVLETKRDKDGNNSALPITGGVDSSYIIIISIIIIIIGIYNVKNSNVSKI